MISAAQEKQIRSNPGLKDGVKARAFGVDFDTVEGAEDHALSMLNELQFDRPAWIFLVTPGALPTKLWQIHPSWGRSAI